MWTAFDYVSFDPPSARNRIYRPILPLEVVVGARRFPCLAVLDTGADFCCFPMSFGLAIGLNPLNQSPTQTVGTGGGGTAATYYFDVAVEIPRLGKFEMRAGFMESLNTIGMGLLGHRGFLDEVRAMFDRKGLKFYIER